MDSAAILCQRGVLLFLLGLLTGLGQPLYKNPRVGLSAHLTGIQEGMALIAFGLLWPKLAFWSSWGMPLAQVLWISFYGIWFALLLAAFFGASRVLPIAGQGFRARPWQELIVSVLMIAASLASLGAIAAVVVQWSWRGA